MDDVAVIVIVPAEDVRYIRYHVDEGVRHGLREHVLVLLAHLHGDGVSFVLFGGGVG